MPGLKINTPDYHHVCNKFSNKEDGHDIDSCDGDAIWKDHSMPHFRDQCDLKQFKQSLHRMTAKIRVERNQGQAHPQQQPPVRPLPAAAAAAPPAVPVGLSGPRGAAPQPDVVMSSPAATSRAVPSTPTAGTAGIPPVELVANDEFTLNVPCHLFGWKDCDSNDHLSLVIYLPTGCTKDDLAFRVGAGGADVEVVFNWSAVMLNPLLPMCAGSKSEKPFCGSGQFKVISFKESVKKLKHCEAKTKVKSVFRVELPNSAEEQLCDCDVPAALATVKCKIKANATHPEQEALALVPEMMCIHTNCQAQNDIEDFELDFNALAI